MKLESIQKTILLTAAKEGTGKIERLLSATDCEVLHAPLEVYIARTDDTDITDTLNSVERFENIVHSSKRNAQFFLSHVHAHSKMDAVKGCLNLAVDESTFEFLESEGIPAIHSPSGSKPIDTVELMLRLKRMEATLYPCGAHAREDIPGFLEELDIPVTELDVFDLKGPSDDQLLVYRQEVDKTQPGTVVFHSRRSVNRTLAAFSDLDYNTLRIISADKGITNKLDEKGISVDAEGEGSWASVAELV